MLQRTRKRTRKLSQALQIVIDRRVFDYIVADVAKSPDAEEGGKYIGYLIPSRKPELQTLGLALDSPAIVVTDYLPSGPNAIRSASQLLPDGEYQEKLFRQIERLDSDIEHVGTWHSHHCNGLETLSNGDIRGYFRTVNKAAYRPNWFLVSLVTRLPSHPNDANWIDHYLFVRGEHEYHRITKTVRVVDFPTSFGQITRHSTTTGAEEKTHDSDDANAPPRSASPSAWYETTEGRATLAEDRSRFTEYFKEHVTATRCANVITLAGRIKRTVVSISYPEDVGASQVTVALRRDEAPILEIRSEIEWRWLAMKAALAVTAELG